MKALTYTVLISLYLVIIAGGVVRMTGSGMGCPDWPKCFGLIIPPTEEEQILFNPESRYSEGDMALRNDTLWVAQTEISAQSGFSYSNWNKYPKHDYAIFNPVHTWIEYINRLVGALSGLFVLGLTVLAFFQRKQYKFLFPLSLLLLVAISIQGWLGSVVVSTELAAYMITIHMVMALVLVLITLEILKNQTAHIFYLRPKYKLPIIALLISTIIQIVLGTQVREHVDELIKEGVSRPDLINTLPVIYIIHRSFSYIIIFLTAVFAIGIYQNKIQANRICYLSLAMIVSSIATGIIMSWYQLPPQAQAIHLVTGSILFGLLYYYVRNLKAVEYH